MSETRKRRQRTWSAFGEDLRRMPSEYEIVTHGANWTLRDGRKAALEQNPSSAANLWFATYREGSALEVADWDAFRDPDAMTYRTYVALQDEQQNAVSAVLDEYSDDGHDATLAPEWLRAQALLLTTTRYPLHAAQQVQAYIGLMAPSSYITNAATFAAADVLRRASLVAYRTRELANAWPDRGFGTSERALWESDEVWQPARELFETALVAYDWAEAFTAMNLVILPTLDALLLTDLRRIAHETGDHLTWMLLGSLETDSERRARWSAALAQFALAARPGNRTPLAKWVDKWSGRAEGAVQALAGALSEVDPTSRTAAAIAQDARDAREALGREAGIVVIDPDEAAVA